MLQSESKTDAENLKYKWDLHKICSPTDLLTDLKVFTKVLNSKNIYYGTRFRETLSRQA